MVMRIKKCYFCGQAKKIWRKIIVQQNDVPANPKDPLINSSEGQTRVLFQQLITVARSRPREHVIGAALNLLVNALRQEHATRDAAEKRFNELMGNTLQVLRDNYNGPQGGRKSVFPFDQVISPQLVVDKDRMRERR